MDRNNWTDEELERTLRDALLRAAEAEWGPALDALPADGPMPGSPAHLRWEKKFLADPFGYVRRRARPRWQKSLRAAAAAALIAALIAALTLGSALAVSPRLRAWAAEWFETHISYRFTAPQSQAGLRPGDWYLAHLPEGYAEVARLESMDGDVTVDYEKSDGTRINFNYSAMVQGSLIAADREDHTVTDLTVNGQPAQLYESTVEWKDHFILIFDETNQIVFTISTWENTQALIAMAESLRMAE